MQITYQQFKAIEPSAGLVAEHAATLRHWYNAPANAQMMGNTVEMTVDDVREYWADVNERRARGFLLFTDDTIVGDAELRNISTAHAEFSIMIGALNLQGQGLGARFSAMLHVFAFRVLGVARVYVQPKPENVRVQRMERSLGYEPDNSPEARALVDDERDLTLSITREVFERVNPWTADVRVDT